jgi:hypothetical protein
MDEHRIGLKPGHASGLGADWATANRFGAPPLHPALPSWPLSTRPRAARSGTWPRVSGIPLFEVELAAFARPAGASPTKQIVLVLDRAGWRTSMRLRVSEHVHLLFLPAYSPELPTAEHLRCHSSKHLDSYYQMI